MIEVIGSVASCGVPCQECGRVLSRNENINIVKENGESLRVCDECLAVKKTNIHLAEAGA